MPVREPLSRARILTAARAVADEHGLGGLTIRALAGRLNVKPMAVYHHLPNKEAILDGLVDEVFAEVELPGSDCPWEEAIRIRCHSMRAVLRRHPWVIGLLESRLNPGEQTLIHHDVMLGTLRAAGFSVIGAGHAYALLDSYVYGFALQEASLPFGPDDAADVAGEMMAAVSAATYPHLTEFAAQRVLRGGYDFGAEFDVGLDVVLAGLEKFRLAG